jgi:hypothetical protein
MSDTVQSLAGSGLKTALEGVVGVCVDGAPPSDGGSAGQASLFGDDDGLVGVSPLASRGESGPKGGRPKGAKNRSTEQWRAFFLSQHRSPLLVLAEAYSMRVGDLASRLGCDLLDAFKLQQAAAAAVLPYVHQRQPQAVEISTPERGVLIIGSTAVAQVATGLGLELPLENTEEYQQLIDGNAVWSDMAKSDGSQQSP